MFNQFISSFLYAFYTFLVVLHTTCAQTKSFDVIVYGGSPSGVIAAYAAAMENVSVALLEPTNHIGGMVSGGLSSTDLGNGSVVGGYAKMFWTRASSVYYNKSLTWHLEPHIAERNFNDLVNEAGVKLFLNARIKEFVGVNKVDKKIVSVTTEDGTIYAGKVFIDGTYEGDLMAFSGVSYTFGREGTSQYNEERAGVREGNTYIQHKNTEAVAGLGNLRARVHSKSVKLSKLQKSAFLSNF